MDFLQAIVLILVGAVLGPLIMYIVPKVLRALFGIKDFEAEYDVESEIKKFGDFNVFEIRFAFNYYRRMSERAEERGKSLMGFSGVLLTLIVAITIQFLQGADHLLATFVALASAICFLLAALISSFYVVFPKGALWTDCKDAIAYLRTKAETVDKMITTAFVFFMFGTMFIFILLISILLT